MDRRDFIKSSLIVIGGSCLACGGKFLYDLNSDEYVCNGVKLEKKHLIEKYKDKSELPKKLRIEACSLCQLNCPWCFRTIDPEKFKNGCGYGYLTFENFKKIVDENDFKEIELANNGEIFLNPELGEIIKYAYEKNIPLVNFVGVNLNYLADGMAETLVKYKFRNLKVSIDGATPKTYAIYRKGGDFNAVIKNIKEINYYKKKYNSKYPELTYKFVLFGHNEHEIDKAKLLAKKLDMKILFDQNHSPWYSPVKNVELVKKKTGIDASLSMAKGLAELYPKNHKEWFYCKDIWERPQINWDGRILGCCMNLDGDFGRNAFKDGLLNALNSTKLIYTKNVVTGNAKPIDGIPCGNCIAYTLMKEGHFVVEPKRRGAYPVF